jgi:hypothetical protein
VRWAQAAFEKPEKDGQFYVWHQRMGKCVMGYVDGSWGGYPPVYWLQHDTCPHQEPSGSFGLIVQPMASKAYPIEDEL